MKRGKEREKEKEREKKREKEREIEREDGGKAGDLKVRKNVFNPL